MTKFNQISPVLDVISLKVKDSVNSLYFYCELLGLDLLIEENDIAYLGSKKTKRAMVALYEFEEGIETTPEQNVLARFSIAVPNTEWFMEIRERLAQADYPFVHYQADTSHEVIRLLDPENHTIDLLNMEGQKAYVEDETKKSEGIIKPTFFLKGTQNSPEELTVHAVRLTVSDVISSHKFYTEILGFKEKLDEKGLKLEFNSEEEEYLRLATGEETLAVDDKFFGLDYLAFRFPDVASLEAYVTMLKNKNQEVYFNKKQSLLQIDDPDGNHLWFYR